jgi:hypothetical protein
MALQAAGDLGTPSGEILSEVLAIVANEELRDRS